LHHDVQELHSTPYVVALQPWPFPQNFLMGDAPNDTSVKKYRVWYEDPNWILWCWNQLYAALVTSPYSYLIGFKATTDDTTPFQIDNEEIVSASWFDKTDILQALKVVHASRK
jgi:hypothetical protein